MRNTSLLARLIHFRDDLVLLWRGFWHPDTPMLLKAAMVAVVAYLISPIDFIPDFIPVLGIVDDVALIAFAVSWIASRLPDHVRNPGRYDDVPPRRNKDNGVTIDGTSRRI